MTLRRCFILIVPLLMSMPVKGQLYYSKLFSEYRLTVGHNLRLAGNAGQGTIAIVNMDKDRVYRKFMAGGFTAGISAYKNVHPKFDMKWTLHVSRQVFFGEAVSLNKGPSPQDALGYTNPVIAEYFAGVNTVAHYLAGKKFSVGVGIGFEFLLASHTSFPYMLSTTDKPVSFRNREFKPLMPVVPIELSWKENRFLYNVRYEIGVTTRYREELKVYGSNLFHTVSFEIGMKIGSDLD